jgi:hypothetical protein
MYNFDQSIRKKNLKAIIIIKNTLFENVSYFKHLGKTATKQNLIWEEIKRRMNSANDCPIQSRAFVFYSPV